MSSSSQGAFPACEIAISRFKQLRQKARPEDAVAAHGRGFVGKDALDGFAECFAKGRFVALEGGLDVLGDWRPC
jgi:hypothetical protein